MDLVTGCKEAVRVLYLQQCQQNQILFTLWPARTHLITFHLQLTTTTTHVCVLFVSLMRQISPPRGLSPPCVCVCDTCKVRALTWNSAPNGKMHFSGERKEKLSRDMHWGRGPGHSALASLYLSNKLHHDDFQLLTVRNVMAIFMDAHLYEINFYFCSNCHVQRTRYAPTINFVSLRMEIEFHSRAWAIIKWRNKYVFEWWKWKKMATRIFTMQRLISNAHTENELTQPTR